MNLKKASAIEIADDVIKSMNKLVYCNGLLYLYNDKYYAPQTEHDINRVIYNYFLRNDPDAWTPGKAAAISEAMKFHPLIVARKEMDDDTDHLCLQNGLLQFSTRDLLPHSPEFFFTSCLEVEYNKEAPVPAFFMKFLEDVFMEKSGPDYHTIDNIVQLGGYLIYPQIKINKIFIFYGTGSNGKSILIEDVFSKFFDDKFISSLSLNTLSNEDSHSRKQLITSKVNFATEQKSGDLESDELKKISNGEKISIRRLYEDTITFSPKCKILVAGNKFVKWKDTSDGLRRRLMIYNFKNKFEPMAKYKEYRNPAHNRVYLALPIDLIRENLKNEMSGILNLFLEGLQRLKDNRWEFEDSDNMREVFREYLAESDWLGSWLTNEWEESEEDFISIRELVEEYRLYFQYYFPDKKFDISTRLIGRRVKELFRIEPVLRNITRDGVNTTTSVYYIKRREVKAEEKTPKQGELI